MKITAHQLIDQVDSLVSEERWRPWVAYDPPNPQGALQQSRTELLKFFEVLVNHDSMRQIGRDKPSKCLQLGLGPSGVSHPMWQLVFDCVMTIDERTILWNDTVAGDGADTHSTRAMGFAKAEMPYDLLFIDAGHGYTDVRLDHMFFSPLVRQGGIVAFHDACKRADIPAHQIWKYLQDELPDIPVIDDDGIGIAWYVKT